MADRSGFTNKEAHKFIQDQGKDVARLPGGREAMGFGKQGPARDGLAAQAQQHLGNVNKANTFSSIQSDAMKK